MKSFKELLSRFLNGLSMLLLVCCFTMYQAAAQSVGISNAAITPDASSILEMRTTTKGLLIPRMTTTERNAIPSPALGLFVFNTSTNAFNFYNGSSWISIVSGSSGVNSVSGTTNRVTVGGTSTDPVIDIASGYAGQNSITTLGTIGTGTWNGTAIGTGYGGTGTATAFTQGSLVFAGAGGVYNQNNSKLFWDNTNFRLGIGTAAPNTALQVGAISAGTENILIGGTSSPGYMLNTQGTGDFGTFYSEATNIVGIGFTPTLSVPSRSVFKVNKTGGATFGTSVSTDDNIKIQPFTGGANSFAGTITTADLTAARTYTLPDATGNIALTSDITKNAVGLGNVDNTSDANKPVSTATQTALNLKANIASPAFTGTVSIPSPFTLGATSVTATGTELNYVAGVTSSIQTQLNNKQAAFNNSAGLATILSDETGSGLSVFSTSPTLTTPILGVASATSLTITGTAGAGYMELQSQSSAPATGPANSVRLFSNGGNLAWKKSDGFLRSFNSTFTADRSYTMPDASGTLAVSASGNIALSAAGNISFTGTLPIANGGTNSTATPTNGGIVYGNGTAYALSAAGTSGQVLQSAGAASPVWADGGTMIFSGNTDGSTVNNQTRYFPLNGIMAGNGTDGSGQRNIVSRSGTIKSFYVRLSVALVAGKTGTVTVFKNGVATALGVTLSVGPVLFSDLADSFTVSAGDEVGVQITTTGQALFSWSAIFTN